MDDCDADSTSPRSRLYTDHIETLHCNDAELIDVFLESLQTRLLQGLYVVTVFSYEFGVALQKVPSGRLSHGLNGDTKSHYPFATILVFARCHFLDTDGVDAWLDQAASNARNDAEFIGRPVAGITNISSNVSLLTFNESIKRVHDYLESGDVYQVNYTYRLHFESYGLPAALYRRLRQRQPAPFGAFIGFSDGRTILSLSPELFLRNQNGLLTAKPMKGTTASSGDAALDSAAGALLATDVKNRAENLMIVDLLRNDLGRIAVNGSVKVPELFNVAKHGAVLQMTSTVTATINPVVTLAEILLASFPCGSITGAPKQRAMELIDELEPDRRGIYTGAIGWFDAPRDPLSAVGDFCLSVPIRTLTLGPENRHGVRSGSMGVGAGIVYDSNATDEYAECVLKASFLTTLPAEFTLFETMRGNRRVGVQHVELHMTRLQRSAAVFGFLIDPKKLHEALSICCSGFQNEANYRIRLTVHHGGHYEIETSVITPLASRVRLYISPDVTHADDLFLQHKSSVRERYDKAWRNAEARGAFDLIFCNSDGEVTEGGRSNIFVKKNGCWTTPPLSAGVLPGIMRSVLLADKTLKTSETRLTLDGLRNADDLFVCNALRGTLPAFIDWTGGENGDHVGDFS